VSKGCGFISMQARAHALAAMEAIGDRGLGALLGDEGGSSLGEAGPPGAAVGSAGGTSASAAEQVG
jgi:hypothetical protein